MEYVINMTRQTISSKSIYQFVLHTSEVCASHDRLRRGGSLLPFQKHTPPMLRVWAEGISGTNTIYPWVTLLKSFPEHPKNAAWLQEDRIFWQNKGCSKDQADSWMLIKVGFCIIYVCILTFWDAPQVAEVTCSRSSEHVAHQQSGKILSCPETFLQTSWQPYHLYFSKAANFQPRLRLHTC